MAKTLSLTSLHAFIACVCALAWQVTNTILAFDHLRLLNELYFFFILHLRSNFARSRGWIYEPTLTKC